MLAEGPVVEEVKDLAAQRREQCQACPHSALQVHTVLKMAIVWLELADGTPITPAVQIGCMMPSVPHAL